MQHKSFWENTFARVMKCPTLHFMLPNSPTFVLVLALGGSSCPSHMYEVTHDFIVVHVKAIQKSLGDKPKCVYIFLQTPHEDLR